MLVPRLLLLGVADRNAFVFRRFWMGFGIPLRDEAASDRTAINRFGWYSFSHCLAFSRCGHLRPPVDDGEPLPPGLVGIHRAREGLSSTPLGTANF